MRPFLRGLVLNVLGIQVLLACQPTRADVLDLPSRKDNTIFANQSLANGQGHSFFVGVPNGGGPRRGLIAFDLSAVPRDATVDRVTVTLFMSRTRNEDQTLSLHRLLADWGEGTSNAGGNEGGGAPATPGDATWAQRFYPDQPWGEPGGDFVGAASATQTVGSSTTFYSWTSVALADDVRGWLADPASNFGWVVIGQEGRLGTSKRFESRESTVPEYVPRLTVEYTPAGGLTGACCVGGTCVRTNATTCAAQGGVYRGDNTGCVNNPCGPAMGACCTHEGCVLTSGAECQVMGGEYAGDGSSCVPGVCSPVLTPFADELPRPSVAVPVAGQPGDAASYELTVRQVRQKLHRDLPLTTLWGYDGQVPGPTIEAAVGRPVTVTWVNDLRDGAGQLLMEHHLHVDECLHGPDHHGPIPRTVTHLHGAHTDDRSDGYPEWTQEPGEASPPFMYPNAQRAATLWYHDHALGITRLNVYMGLAGAYLLRDPAEAALNLPAGEYEVPLIIMDRSLRPDGTLRYPHDWHEHYFGEFILVNGRVWPYLNVSRGKYRFRIVNGSGSRVYQLSLSNGSPITQIGTDHGLLERPVTRANILIAPGERADVVIDFGRFLPGEDVTLVNSAPAPYPGPPGAGVVPNVMKFIVGGASGHTAPLPATLSTYGRLSEADSRAARTFELAPVPDACTGDRWLINGLMWDDITEFPTVGTVEVWSFVNRSGFSHPMHLHHSPFQVLDRQSFVVVGGEVVPSGPRVSPPSHELGWKDTVRSDPNQITRVIVRFDDYTGVFPYHCHVLEHEDNEMMRQMIVVPCAADFNQDGGVDGADVEAFYLTWESGEVEADINHDGGVDGADVEAFYVVWAAGGC